MNFEAYVLSRPMVGSTLWWIERKWEGKWSRGGDLLFLHHLPLVWMPSCEQASSGVRQDFKIFFLESWNIQKVLHNKDPGQLTTSAGFGVFNEPVTDLLFCFFFSFFSMPVIWACWCAEARRLYSVKFSKMWLCLSWRFFKFFFHDPEILSFKLVF